MSGVTQFVERLAFYIINPIIVLLFAAALVLFLWGVAQFIWNVGGGGDEDRERGKRHMLWGIIGMFLMFSAIAILRVFGNTFGFTLPT